MDSNRISNILQSTTERIRQSTTERIHQSTKEVIQSNTKKTENCLPLLIVPTSGRTSLGEFRMIFPQEPQENTTLQEIAIIDLIHLLLRGTTGVLQAGIAILRANTPHRKEDADSLQKDADYLQKDTDSLQKGAIHLAGFQLREIDTIPPTDNNFVILLPEIMPRTSIGEFLMIQRVSPEEFPVPGRLSTMMSGLQVVFGCFLD